MPKPTRRSAILGTAATGVAMAVPAASAAVAPSPELQRYLAGRSRYVEAGNSYADGAESLAAEAGDLCDVEIRTIMNRATQPGRSQRDVYELAQVVSHEQYELDAEGLPNDQRDGPGGLHGELNVALVRAILMGGVNA